ncbi:MAG: bifunctional methylenetetrahydrofolate dehydrogenase/methenyltetrahydrofolate cyclohydrolase FolD [Parachlamydiaceae bacterium]|nr:bifunctional methylenetetrahydrofolate dehydrogenase/methenyltetrahydrofolate cyclohydrolase FolD [Parachlamydiaceae bacterium]
MLIDGKAIAAQIQEELKLKISHIKARKPCLAVIIVGNNPASKIYVDRKTKACAEVGILSIRQELPASTSEQTLIQSIKQLNNNADVDGILIQLPLPAHINPLKITQIIDPAKDVDGLHPSNIGKLMSGDQSAFIPCTPLGVKELLERSEIDVASKHVLVIGRSNLVGKPMAAILMQSAAGGNATVTIAHSRTNNLKELSLMADILIVAIGQAKKITADMVKKGSIIIDVGINKIEDPTRKSGYQLVGDVDFENVKEKCSLITPVPGGVGPMTIAMLLSNTLKSYLQRNTDAC